MTDKGETTSTVIGGRKYTLTHVPTSAGIRLGALLVNTLAPGFAGMTGDMSVSTALSQMLRQGELGDRLLTLCEGFAPYTEVEVQAAGKNTPALSQTLQGCFETHFAGRYDALIEWLLFAIQWDLSSFLAGAFAAFKRASAAAEGLASQSKSPKPAEGTG